MFKLEIITQTFYSSNSDHFVTAELIFSTANGVASQVGNNNEAFFGAAFVKFKPDSDITNKSFAIKQTSTTSYEFFLYMRYYPGRSMFRTTLCPLTPNTFQRDETALNPDGCFIYPSVDLVKYPIRISSPPSTSAKWILLGSLKITPQTPSFTDFRIYITSSFDGSLYNEVYMHVRFWTCSTSTLEGVDGTTFYGDAHITQTWAAYDKYSVYIRQASDGYSIYVKSGDFKQSEVGYMTVESSHTFTFSGLEILSVFTGCIIRPTIMAVEGFNIDEVPEVSVKKLTCQLLRLGNVNIYDEIVSLTVEIGRIKDKINEMIGKGIFINVQPID